MQTYLWSCFCFYVYQFCINELIWSSCNIISHLKINFNFDFWQHCFTISARIKGGLKKKKEISFPESLLSSIKLMRALHIFFKLLYFMHPSLSAKLWRKLSLGGAKLLRVPYTPHYSVPRALLCSCSTLQEAC